MPAGMDGILLVSAIIAGACLQSALLTALAIVVARSLRLLDWPDKTRKLHRRATPLMGGVAIVLTLALTLWECQLAGVNWLTADPKVSHLTSMLVFTTALLCGVGLWDDKFGMCARTKFLLQIACILPYVWWGRSTTMVNVFGWELQLAWLGVPLMLLWLVACTNFVNLVDGLDGLASLVSMIVILAVGVLACLQGLHGVLCISAVMTGAIAGFLLHNWPPAKIFLGDSGSLPLGFLVGALAVEASVKKAAGLTLAVPLVLLSIPMFDTSMAILRRKLNGRKIGQGDRQHIHHILRDRGLTPHQTLLTIGFLCFTMATAAVLATVFQNDVLAIGLCAALLALLVGARVFGFNEMALLTRHVRGIWLWIRSIPAALQSQFVLARLSDDPKERQLQLWRYLVNRLEKINGLSLEYSATDLDTQRDLAAMTWLNACKPISGMATWEVSFAMPRENGIMVTLVATGLMPEIPQSLRVNELLDIFAIFCASSPVQPSGAHPELDRYITHRAQPTVRKPHFFITTGAAPTTPLPTHREAA